MQFVSDINTSGYKHQLMVNHYSLVYIYYFWGLENTIVL